MRAARLPPQFFHLRAFCSTARLLPPPASIPLPLPLKRRVRLARLRVPCCTGGLLRGFSTNVANYQPLGTAVCDRALFATETKPTLLRQACGGGGACCADPCRVLGTWGWGEWTPYSPFA